MAYTPINIGAAPNDDTGDDLRFGGNIINTNFASIDAQLAGKLNLTGGTITGNLTLSNPGASGILTTQGETGSSVSVEEYSSNSQGVTYRGRKSRGTIATPAICANGDRAFQLTGEFYDGASFQLAMNMTCDLIQTPSSGAVQGRVRLFVAPNGGTASGSEVLRIEYGTGLSMFGANPVINQDRHFVLRQYTIATLPASATTGALAMVTDSADTIAYRGTPTTGGGAGKCMVMWNGSGWEYH